LPFTVRGCWKWLLEFRIESIGGQALQERTVLLAR